MNGKQKDNLSKFTYDLAKIVIAITVITPMAKPGIMHVLSSMLGLLAGSCIAFFGYYLDSVEVAK